MAKLRIREMAAKRGKTMNDIMYDTGIASSTLSRINNGNQSPSIDLLEKIAQYLQCSIGELVVMEEQFIECPHCHKLIKVKVEKD